MNAGPLERRRACITGAELVLTYSSRRSDVEATARAEREVGSAKPHFVQSDLSRPHDGRRMARQIADDLGNIDVLMSNAG